jgi:hypothetical protein
MSTILVCTPIWNFARLFAEGLKDPMSRFAASRIRQIGKFTHRPSQASSRHEVSLNCIRNVPEGTHAPCASPDGMADAVIKAEKP